MKTETLYKVIRNMLKDDVLRIDKLIGIGNDGASSMFQSRNADFCKLTEDLFTMIRSVLQQVIQNQHVARFSNKQLVEMEFQDYLLPTSAMYFGYEFDLFTSSCNLDENFISVIKHRCRDFILCMIDQIKMRLPDNLKVLLNYKSYKPEAVLGVRSMCPTAIAASYP